MNGPGVNELDAVERWFVARGLPHFVERHDSAWTIWGRATPLLAVAYVLLGLNALDVRHWSVARNLAVAGFVVAGAVVTWVVANALRRRPLFERPRRIGPAELAVFVVVPAIPSLVVAQPGDALQTAVTAVAILVVLWALTSYGIPTLVAWAWRRTWTQLSTLTNVLSRALPMLLLFSAFLFINAEAWQVAGTLSGVVFIAVLGSFFMLGASFVLIRIPALMRSLNRFDSWQEVADLSRGTPAVALLDDLAEPPDGDPHAGRPTVRQRVNIGLLSVFSQAIQVTLVGVGLAGFFVLFGFLAIPEATAAGWTGLADVHVLASWSVGERELVLSEPLLRVAAFLGAFGAMYFTVQLSTDSLYREEFADDVGPQLRQALAVRCVYRTARSGSRAT